MIKSELVDWLADELNITRREAKSMVDSVLEGIVEALASDGHLTLRGFGTFEVRRRGAREPRPVFDHASAAVPGQSGVLFRPSRPLRSRLESRMERS
ncbi:MAG: HU family DNA-binding protein [Chloroflexi bacterium]|nr:HU family DNA-binding protein [Chloroflexota bacterium]